MSPLAPADAAEVAAAVSLAVASRTPLSVSGLGSKSALGRPSEAVRRLDLSALSGVTLYEPEELVLSALAATPIETIETLLSDQGQELAFEPMSFSRIYGTGAGTLGGCVMANLSGPRRIKAGAARDHVLGVKAVSGRGEAFKAGGRVVKNVTGYDLPRALAGSFGTLAVATEITVKVLPAPETVATLVLSGLDPGRAIAALCTAMGAPVDVSGAAHLPAAAAQRQGYSTALTVLRVEGFAPSVKARFERLAAILKPFGPSDSLDAEASKILWSAIRDVAPLATSSESLIWKCSVAPTAGPRVADACAEALSCEALFDWSGGLVWLAVEPSSDLAADAGAEVIKRAVAAQGGGHATLVRAPAELRGRIDAFGPQDSALVALSRRLKAAFDPNGILEPRRLFFEF
ncbi:FAD-binding protein [Methylocapsa acidiphila]|uniref:FAD-binding protein n=1 Tax=Methylocapsa acidiphila TaxID=133552 RepID=UPI00047B6D7E|nr:FAD-binding protein [Methylocapsa acidiphila]